MKIFEKRAKDVHETPGILFPNETIKMYLNPEMLVDVESLQTYSFIML